MAGGYSFHIFIRMFVTYPALPTLRRGPFATLTACIVNAIPLPLKWRALGRSGSSHCAALVMLTTTGLTLNIGVAASPKKARSMQAISVFDSRTRFLSHGHINVNKWSIRFPIDSLDGDI